MVAGPSKKTQVWEVKLSQEGHRGFIKSLDTCGAINIWLEESSTMDVMVSAQRAAAVAGLLHAKEIEFSIALPDVGTMLEKERGSFVAKNIRSSASSLSRRQMDWKSYHRLDVIYAFLDNLAKENPFLCSVHTIGRTVEGRNIKMLKISNGSEDNEGVWVDGTIHAREWISTSVVTYIANYIVRNYNKLSPGIQARDWYILPVLNPDGYEYTHTTDRMWRKNRARYGECVGVDLNRNFSYAWGDKGEEGSSDDPGNVFYRGPEPFSEPEAIAVKDAIMNSGTQFKVFISFHSYGEVVIFPWGHCCDPCPDYVNLLEGGTAISKGIYETNGKTYKVGSTKDLMYYAAGTSVDWSYGVAKIPYSYMVELRGKKHRFLLPKEEILATATEAMNGVFRLIDFVDGKCRNSSDACVCPK